MGVVRSTMPSLFYNRLQCFGDRIFEPALNCRFLSDSSENFHVSSVAWWAFAHSEFFLFCLSRVSLSRSPRMVVFGLNNCAARTPCRFHISEQQTMHGLEGSKNNMPGG